MLCKYLPTLGNFKFCFLEFSVIFFQVFLIHGGLNPRMQNPWICTTFLLCWDLKSNISHLLVFLFAVLFSRLTIFLGICAARWSSQVLRRELNPIELIFVVKKLWFYVLMEVIQNLF